VRLLAKLQADSVLPRLLDYLNSDVPEAEKLHLAMHLRFLESGWTPPQRLALVDYYEKAQTRKGGGSYPYYLINVARDFARTFNQHETQLVLEHGETWPAAALGTLYNLPETLDDPLRRDIEQLDARLANRTGEAVERLQAGIVAVLARSGDEKSLSYLRHIWDTQPERRTTVALGLAQAPQGENWDYLVRSLPVLEGPAAPEVLARLCEVDQRPTDAESLRQVILRGLSLKEDGADQAVALLEHWTGAKLPHGETSLATLASWQKWFADTYPDHAPAILPKSDEAGKWNFDELLAFLGGEEAVSASAQRGATVFAKAQCAKCHRVGDEGESLGPDLTSVGRRFTRKEVLESIVYPSHVVSDQWAAKTVVTQTGRKFTGIVAQGSAGELIVITQEGAKVAIARDAVDEIVPSRTSAMPTQLLDQLTLDEIADLFAYLGTLPQHDVARQPAEVVPK
jgi:putative heme-binding domain-containing protein